MVTGSDGSTTKTYTINVLNAGVLALSDTLYTVVSGPNPTSIDLFVERTGGTGPTRGSISTSDGSAIGPTQYITRTAAVVNLAKDQNLARVTIQIAAKATTTTAKTFTVTLSDAGSGVTLGTSVTAMVVILPPAGATDTAKPTLTITAPAKNALINDNTPVTLTGSVKDNVGIRRVQLSLDGGVTYTDVPLGVPGAAIVPFSIPLTPVTGLN